MVGTSFMPLLTETYESSLSLESIFLLQRGILLHAHDERVFLEDLKVGGKKFSWRGNMDTLFLIRFLDCAFQLNRFQTLKGVKAWDLKFMVHKSTPRSF